MISKYFLFVVLVCSVLGQELAGCRNHQGQLVDWFLVYHTPNNIQQHAPLYGYLYMDSTSTTDQFQIYKGRGYQSSAPLGLTIAQIKQHNLQSIAWNDQLHPHQGIGNSNKAQSKLFMAVKQKSNGFVVIHSSPQFPTISKDGTFTLPSAEDIQKQKAQHFLCMTIRGAKQVTKLMQSSCFINPNIYHDDFGVECSGERENDIFTYENYRVGNSLVRTVYKNGYGHTADIFAQGIAPIVQSPMVVQSFGSPHPFSPACKMRYTVGNTNEIVISEGIRWRQSADNSKWTYTLNNNYVCFGDLDRNSQRHLERGGAFYCWESKHLSKALKNINPEHAGC